MIIIGIKITVLQTPGLLFYKLVVCLPRFVLHKCYVCFSALLFRLYSVASMNFHYYLCHKGHVFNLCFIQRKHHSTLPTENLCPLIQTAGCSVFNIAHTLPAFRSILIKLTRSHFTFIHIILMYNYLLSINPQCMTIIILSAIGSITRDFASSSRFVWSLSCRANFHIPQRKNC